MLKRILTLAVVVIFCASCQMFFSLLHDDQLVAKVGNHRLYASQVNAYIPVGISSEDSLGMAEKYIRAWADDMLFDNLAKKQLSKSEQDVKGEIEAYKRSLLRYRYEQRYITEMLDTVVTDLQIEEYYKQNINHFLLDRPVLKVRFVDIMKDSPNLELMLEKMSSEMNEDLEDADSLANISAFRYYDNSDRWMDAAVLAREFDLDHDEMLSHLKGGFISMEQHANAGEVRIAYVCDMIGAGNFAPIEFCSENIRSIIIHNRKQKLITGLEQDLLDEALKKKTLVIYQ